MEKVLVYENDKMALFKITEEINIADKHFSTITYEPSSAQINVLTTKGDLVVVEYYHEQPKCEKHLYIYNCKKTILKTPNNFIPYNHSEGFKEEVCIDGCLENEIKRLWSKGIVTTGCCCGHGMNLGFIQVRTQADIDKMRSLGYQHYIYKDEYGGVNRKDAFIPKTTRHSYYGYSDGHLG